MYSFALVAQWIEHPPPKGRVTRSIRVGGAIHRSGENPSDAGLQNGCHRGR